MRTLFLDLASHAGLIACIDGNRIVASKSIDHRISDGELVPTFTETLREAKWKQEDIERIACVIGPGGFTSLRVAVAFANALSYALSLPVTPIHLSDLYAERAETKNFLWLHSTKKTQLFVRGFGLFEKQFPEAKVTTLDSLITDLPDEAPLVGELIPDHETAIASKGGTHAATKDLLSILPQFVESQTYEKKTLLPWYGRGW